MNIPHSRQAGCLVCGAPLIYRLDAMDRLCHYCGRSFETSVACEAGHYVCDACHAGAMPAFFSLLLACEERDVLSLFEQVTALEGVHLHGPEHHSLVPCVLLTAYRNNGGVLDLSQALIAAISRGSQVPGGICGAWGACGAAVGAGIYASLLLGSTPLKVQTWSAPQMLTARALERMAAVGGPRCCKRTSRLALEAAVEFTQTQLGVALPLSARPCTFGGDNRECIKARCPYFPTTA